MDNCKCIHTFQQNWENTKKLLADSYDLVATKENPLPQPWMRIEIKLGVSLNVVNYRVDALNELGRR
jgi:hypothetical protein